LRGTRWPNPFCHRALLIPGRQIPVFSCFRPFTLAGGNGRCVCVILEPALLCTPISCNHRAFVPLFSSLICFPWPCKSG
jgi:hypothetical protein